MRESTADIPEAGLGHGHTQRLGHQVTTEHNGFELDNKRISPDAMDALMRNEPLDVRPMGIGLTHVICVDPSCEGGLQ